MGVSTNIYTVYGITIDGFDKDLFEAYDKIYNDADAPEIIMDGMGGDYTILGCVLFDSGDFRWGLEGGYPLTEVSLDDGHLKNLEEKYKENFVKKLPEFKHLVENVQFKLIMFTHYS